MAQVVAIDNYTIRYTPHEHLEIYHENHHTTLSITKMPNNPDSHVDFIVVDDVGSGGTLIVDQLSSLSFGRQGGDHDLGFIILSIIVLLEDGDMALVECARITDIPIGVIHRLRQIGENDFIAANHVGGGHRRRTHRRRRSAHGRTCRRRRSFHRR